MRAKIALLVGACLLGGAIAAQPVPCASVAPEVRDRVREAGACRDATSDDAASNAAVAPSGTVTMTLSDGTVVRIPREISSDISNGRKRPATNEAAPPKSVPRASASAPSKPAVRGGAPLAPQKLQVPDVIGRSDADARSALAEFKVDRVQTASAAPAGEVLAQDPAPSSLVLPGSTVSLQVSDGSLAAAATTGTEPAATDASTTAPATAAVPAPARVAELVPPTTRAGESATRGFPIVFSANTALVLGVGVSLGLILGALLMRQWSRRELPTDQNAAAPALYLNQPVDSASIAAATEPAAEIHFAARRDPGETTIEFVALADDEAVAIEQSSEQHG